MHVLCPGTKKTPVSVKGAVKISNIIIQGEIYLQGPTNSLLLLGGVSPRGPPRDKQYIYIYIVYICVCVYIYIYIYMCIIVYRALILRVTSVLH